MAFRKNLTILLIVALFFSLFLGGYHHCCDYYSQTCSTCSQTAHQPIFLTAADTAYYIQPLPVTSYLVLPAEIFPDPPSSYTPLRGRAPPRCS